MLRVVVMVSGGGTNLQAIIDRVADGTITNAEIVGVISNNANAYALERAKEHGISACCISPKEFESREIFNEKLLEAVDAYAPYDQYSSVFDPFLLWKRILRTEGT